jgi:sigma-B regulation protein RsbQ
MLQEPMQRLNLTVIGEDEQKPVMLFAQGLGLDQNIWRLITPMFSNRYRIVLFDYTTAGRENQKPVVSKQYSSLSGYADDVIAICDHLKIQQCIFVGHSVGCMIGLLAALQRPDAFRKMIFIGPSPRYLNDSDGYWGGFRPEEVDQTLKSINEDYIGWVKTTIPGVANTSDKELEQEIMRTFITADKEMLKQFATATFFSDHRRDLLKFHKQSLILQTNADFMVPVQVGDYLHAHLRNSTLITLKGTGHFPQLTAASEVVDCINIYLAA